jgi:hypothetical protein
VPYSRAFIGLHPHHLIYFSGDVYSVEVALDLNELEALTTQRRNVRDALEKSIAIWKATGICSYCSASIVRVNHCPNRHSE